ncbi:MAG TPA: sensor histidine kinase KdpD [Gemmatimonadales bacterium]|nr:sensor histidine kinase KdpD [Gemmatimonadales bacterium]
MNERPSPEAMLERVRAEEARAGRGRLKIFFGASPGVGKTYAMLEDARAKKREGVDVVVGIVETHGRAETAALLEGLEVLPRSAIEYRGVALREFDLDAALARKPGLILVDELAHTNAPGSRHARRWQDVEELLAAGINVSTTLNVQHLESLNDVVAQITGVQVRETVPDTMLDEADEVELADLSADDLLRRLQEGKVYVPDQAARAIQEFFRKGNLIALRELALRRTAERVDAQMRGYMQEHGIHETWPAADRLLVCIGPNPAGARLVRAGKRIATTLKCDWVVLYVEAPGQRISASDREALQQNLQLAQELGAQVVSVSGENVADEVLAYARAHNSTRVVVGKPTHAAWRDKLYGSTLDKLVRGSGDVDVYVISGDDAEEKSPRRVPLAVRPSPWSEYARAAVVPLICTAFGFGIMRVLSLTDVAMVFLLGVALVASRYGRGPTVFASFLSIALFDFCFVPPQGTFAVSDVRYVLTFGVMLAIALIMSNLTLRIRAQAETARERERRTGALYAMSRELAATREQSQLVATVIAHVRDTFGTATSILLPDEARRLAIPRGSPADVAIDDKERSVATWVFEHGESAGAGTDTLPASQGLYIPLVAASGIIGVLGLRPSDPRRFQDPAVQQLLETFAGQAALALERAMLAEQAQREQVEIEAERLRTSLLSSLSHDLRTPLAAITGAASSLLEGRVEAEATRTDLLQAILEEASRMNRLIANLLDMIRVESGALQVQKEWQPLEEPVGVALIRLEEKLRGRSVNVHLGPELPLVPVDAVLIEQVFVNLLENAVKYTPAGTPIDIAANARDGIVTVEVADRGPGIPTGEETKIFDKFYRSSSASSASGVGLGLTISRGIIMAHGGRITAENRAGGGAVFRFTLPITGSPPPAVPPEPAER